MQYYVDKNAKGRTFNDINNVPTMQTALLLGTNPKARGGKKTEFLLYGTYQGDSRTLQTWEVPTAYYQWRQAGRI